MIQKIEKQNVFIIPDIHGCYEELEKMLENVPEDTLIVFLGDYIDRGADSKKAAGIVMNLVQNGQAVAIKGNHEAMLLDSINGMFNWKIYMQNGGDKALFDFNKDYIKINNQTTFKNYIDAMNEHNKAHLTFFENLPFAIEMDNYLFVHAGVIPEIKNVEDIMEDEVLWIREGFYQKPHQLPHKIFFGHTPIMNIDESYKTQSIWYDQNQTKFGLDGGCVFGYKLNGVYLDVEEESLQVFQTWKEDGEVKSEKKEKINKKRNV